MAFIEPLLVRPSRTQVLDQFLSLLLQARPIFVVVLI